MKTALCLSGGGARGAFQAGALLYLASVNTSIDCIAGVSAGALNGIMVAQGKLEELENLWKTTTEETVFKKNGWLKILWNNLVMKKRSLHDLTPLADRLATLVNKEDIKIPFYMGVTSLYDGKYYCLSDKDFVTSQRLREGIYASSLMPIFWEPITLKTSTSQIYDVVDGGVKNIIPLKDILKEGADRIIVITCSNTTPVKKEQKNLVDITKRTFMDLMLGEVIDNDIKGILMVNEMVKQAEAQGVILRHPSGRPLKYFEVILIEPPYHIGSPTDFTRDVIDQNLVLGWETAKKVIERQ
jgi:NTE family protein